MEQAPMKERIAARAARELRDGDVVNLGIGLPTLIPKHLPEGVRVILEAEDGIVGPAAPAGPAAEDGRYSVDAGGRPVGVETGGAYIDSCASFALIRGGHIDCTVLGALEVDREGSLANWIVPGKKVPGMGGAMDLVVGARRVIVVMEHTVGGRPKILERCALPRTAVRCVDLVITEMGVIEVTENGLRLTERSPEFSPGEIQDATGARLDMSSVAVRT